MVLPASSIFRPRMCLEWCSSRARQCLQPAFLGYFQCRTGNDSVGFNAIDLWIDIAVLTLLARHLVILVSPIMSTSMLGDSWSVCLHSFPSCTAFLSATQGWHTGGFRVSSVSSSAERLASRVKESPVYSGAEVGLVSLRDLCILTGSSLSCALKHMLLSHREALARMCGYLWLPRLCPQWYDGSPRVRRTSHLLSSTWTRAILGTTKPLAPPGVEGPLRETFVGIALGWLSAVPQLCVFLLVSGGFVCSCNCACPKLYRGLQAGRDVGPLTRRQRAPRTGK